MITFEEIEEKKENAAIFHGKPKIFTPRQRMWDDIWQVVTVLSILFAIMWLLNGLDDSSYDEYYYEGVCIATVGGGSECF